MGVLSFEREITTSIPPTRMFKVFVLEADTAIPHIIPQVVKSVDIIEGNGGPGTIKKTTFAEGSKFSCIKTQIDATDKDNFTHCYRVIEDELWMNMFEKISYEMKIMSSPNGGSIIRSTSRYHKKENSTELNEDTFKAGAEKALAIFKIVEAYLLANPDAYN